MEFFLQVSNKTLGIVDNNNRKKQIKTGDNLVVLLKKRHDIQNNKEAAIRCARICYDILCNVMNS